MALTQASVAEARFWKAKFENHLDFAPMFYFEDVGQGTTQNATVFREQPEFSMRPLSYLKIRLAPYAYSDLSARSPSERFIGDINEANADLRMGEWNLRVGYNSVAWGVTDVFNPLDVVSARRYTDLLNSEKRGVPSVDLNWDNGGWRAEAIYVPIQQEAILPGEYSRWLPRDIVYTGQVDGYPIVIDPNLQYNYTSKNVVDNALNNNYGFRLERHGSGLDLTAIFFQGSPTAPAINPTQITLINTIAPIRATQISIQPTYYVRRTVGAGMVWTLDTMILRFEASNSDAISTGNGIPGWVQSGVLGLEKNFAFSTLTLTTLLQTTLQYHQDSGDNTVTSLDRIFDRSWLLGLRLATSSAWSWSAAGLYDAAYQGTFDQLKVERKLTDGISASVEADWLDGAPGTPLGTYRRNRRGIFTLATSF